MKKIISVLLVFVLLLSFAACAQTPAESGAAADESQHTPQPQQPETAPPSEAPDPPAEGDEKTEEPQQQSAESEPLELIEASSYEEIYAALKQLSERDEGQLRYGVISDFAEQNQVVDEAVPEASGDDAAYCGTNVQVAGIDEGDIVKTDGKYIYILQDESRLVILRAAGADTKVVSDIQLGYLNLSGTVPEDIRGHVNQERTAAELFIYEDTLAVIYQSRKYFEEFQPYSGWRYDRSSCTEVEFYDVSDPAKPKLTETLGQDGDILGTRLYEGRLYVVTSWGDYNYGLADPVKRSEDLIPALYENGSEKLLEAKDVVICPGGDSNYVIAAAYDMARAQAIGVRSVLGAGNMLYMSGENIYVAGRAWNAGASEPYKEDIYTVTDYFPSTKTRIVRFSLSDSGPELSGAVLVPGYLESQYSMDEYGGYLRLVTTVDSSGYRVYVDEEKGFVNYDWFTQETKTNSLYILDEDLLIVGSVEDLAEGERVYSARFDGSIAYFCTFEQTDPLFAVDCSEPENPVVLSALKISGFSEYLHQWGENQLFGFGYEADESTGWVEGLKMVMFDTTDKADVSVENFLHLEDVMWSEALYEPHAFFIAPEKNIIGFVGDGTYYIYGYSVDNGFYLRAELDFLGRGYGSRGLYVGSEIYLLGRDGGCVLDLESCSLIKNLYW